MNKKILGWALAAMLLAPAALAQDSTMAKKPDEPVLPYSPSLDLSSMDRSVDPCADFYHYACAGWQKRNPIPEDQTSWSVYGKLYQDNLNFLRGILEEASIDSGHRDNVTREVGDFYAACMDEAAVEKRGISAVQPQLEAIAGMHLSAMLAPLVARLQLVYGRSVLFAGGSVQDLDNSEQVIAELDQGGLGLPDRDYYTKTDDKSKETRARYLEHVEKIFVLMGESPEAAKKDAATVMRVETEMAQAQLTRVERRDPYNLKHKMNLAQLNQLAPKFDWTTYYRVSSYPEFTLVNVDTPEFFKELNTLIATEPLDNWRTLLRFDVVNSASPYLSSAFVDENYDFYRKYLRGAKAQQPRWKRCVTYTDRDLPDALGQVYVAKVFSPELKQSTLEMVQQIEVAMGQRIEALDWMSPETKKQALVKLHGIRNKIGYPDKWRDYSSIKIVRDDFAGTISSATEFENRRQIAKIGKPVDHTEWGISAPTVDAYYDPQMNDINFPAGVLQPPLYDPKMDAAPNYGNTGGTIGHELTHAFDDEGSQFDAQGNLRNWWTKEDRVKFDERTKCVRDQYAQYVVVDDVHINSDLTLGEDVADLGGEILAFVAWKSDTKGQNLQSIDGLTPEQRFFVGFAQWDCANERPEELRLRAATDPHSPPIDRINGVVVNMPEFTQAFACKEGQPMVKPAAKVCHVW
jgi:putative endopeptidase